MKEYYKRFKKFRSDPKKRSLTLLIIYGIFFIFVFIYISSHKALNNQVNDNLIINNLKEISSYEYTLNLEYNENIIAITGTYYNGENKFELDSQEYTIKDNIINKLDYTFQFDIDKITNQLSYNSIKEFIKNYDYDSKTEYKTGDIKYEYLISNKDLAKYLNEEASNEEESKITIYENKYINEIQIDLSNLYEQDKYIITIKYSNVNNITNIEQNNINKIEG